MDKASGEEQANLTRKRKKPNKTAVQNNKNKKNGAIATTKKRKTILQHRRERKRLEQKEKKKNNREQLAPESKPNVIATSPTKQEVYYEVEKVVGRRVNKGRVEYLIRWRGCSESDNTWEPASNLCDTAMSEALRYVKAETLKAQQRLEDERKLGLLPPEEGEKISEQTTSVATKNDITKETDDSIPKNDTKKPAIPESVPPVEHEDDDMLWKWADQDQIIFQPVERIHVHDKNVQKRVTDARVNGTPIVLVGHVGWANFAKKWLIPVSDNNSNDNENDDIDQTNVKNESHKTALHATGIQPPPLSSSTASSSLSSSASWNESSTNGQGNVDANDVNRSSFLSSSSSPTSSPDNDLSKGNNVQIDNTVNHGSNITVPVSSFSSSSCNDESANKDNCHENNSNNIDSQSSLPSAAAADITSTSGTSSSWNEKSESTNNGTDAANKDNCHENNSNNVNSQSSLPSAAAADNTTLGLTSSWNEKSASNPNNGADATSSPICGSSKTTTASSSSSSWNSSSQSSNHSKTNIETDAQSSALPNASGTSVSCGSSSWNESSQCNDSGGHLEKNNNATNDDHGSQPRVLEKPTGTTPKVVSPTLSLPSSNNTTLSSTLLDLSKPHELDISKMLQDIGSEDVPVVRRNYNETNPIHGVIPASKFLDKCWPSSTTTKEPKEKEDIGAASRLYLHQWQFPLSDTAGRKLCHQNNPLPNNILGEDLLKYWIDLPQCKLDSPLQYLFMGREETLSKLHRDNGGLAISIAPIVGEKECVMVHRSDGSSCLYHLDADLEHADLQSFPLMARARVWKTSILPGEILLMPQGTYHQCRNLKPCLSYSRFHLDTVNLHAFLQSKLDRDAPEIVHDDVLWNCTSELARQLDAFVDRVREHRKQNTTSLATPTNGGSVLVDEKIIRIVDTLRSLRHVVREVARRIATKNAIKGKGSHEELMKSLQAEHDWNIIVDDVDVSLHEFRYRHLDKVPNFKPRRCKLFLGNKLLHRPDTMSGSGISSSKTTKSTKNTSDLNSMQAVAYDTGLEKRFLELPPVPDSSAVSLVVDPSTVSVGDNVSICLCGKQVPGSVLRIESQMSAAFLSYDEYPALYDDFQPYETLRSPVTGAEVRPDDIKAGVALVHRDGGSEHRGVVQHTACETMFWIRLEIGKFKIERWLTIGSILNQKDLARMNNPLAKKCFDVEDTAVITS